MSIRAGVISSVVLVALAAAAAGAADLDKDGVFGLAWGEPITDEPGLIEMYTVRGGDTAYSFVQAPSSFLGAPIADVTLWGCSGRLVGATVEFSDLTTLPVVKKRLAEMLGAPLYPRFGDPIWNGQGLSARMDVRFGSVRIVHAQSRETYCPPPLPKRPTPPRPIIPH